MIPTKAKGFNQHLATDEDATPLDDKRFLLTEPATRKGAVAVRWETFHWVNDGQMYAKFRDLIYRRKSPWEWCLPGRQVALGTFLVLVVLGLMWDKKDLEQKRQGKTLKGFILVSRWQFN